ncbi:MAG TPA: hypothetical protein DEP72_03060 [Clostridiales bacterium]|nr:MAG: hypothetical protein A2Y18_04590 [Clostridiales bacterium GWD2_32_19]HCC07132.1 hypothetical protein [Clostridiales bacterium]
MVNQERIMVLKMLEDGKINAEEALKLLDALNANSVDNFIGENAVKMKELFEEVKVKADEFAKRVGPHVNVAREKIEETYKKLEPTIMDVGSKAKKVANDVADQINKSIKKNCKSDNDCNCDCKENKENKENKEHDDFK